MKVDKLLYLKAVSLCNNFIALPPEIGQKCNGARFMLISAVIPTLEADIGAGCLALRVHADLLGLFVIDTRHIFHDGYVD